jgi:hypothetical protein
MANDQSFLTFTPKSLICQNGSYACTWVRFILEITWNVCEDCELPIFWLLVSPRSDSSSANHLGELTFV